MDTVIMFDVNETLLDLAPVRTWFSERFVGGPTAREWFTELLRLSFVSSVTDRYTPFTDLAGHALTSAAQRHSVLLKLEDTATIKSILATLPPHSDVIPGLAALMSAGFTLAALTNSPLATANTQLENAEIAEYFDTIMSVDMVERFKPHRSVYLAAAMHLGASPADIVMVAAHDWDIAGAEAAGLDGVFIERPGQLYSTAMERPTISAPDIINAANAIINEYG